MTTDRELLELAAKAAGMNYAHELCGYYSDPEFNEVVQWNPLTDDGDALRLAVKLWLLDEVSVMNAQYESDDPYAATRRAIVRAAAELGRSMK